MSPTHLGKLYLVELEKLFRRLTAWLGVGVATLTGLGPLFLFIIGYALFVMLAPEGTPFEGPTGNTAGAVIISFALRGFLLFPILLFIAAGRTFAAEFNDRTLREDLLRPVPRWAVVLSKWAALSTWVVATVLVTWVLSLGTGLMLVGTEEEFAKDASIVLLRYVLAELAFTSLAVLVAALTRSVAATLGSLIILLFMQFFGSALLWGIVEVFDKNTAMMLVPQVPEFAWDYTITAAEALQPWQPPFVLESCLTCFGSGPELLTWQATVTLAVILIGSLAGAIWRFETMDVP